jgi:hypothetical protein
LRVALAIRNFGPALVRAAPKAMDAAQAVSFTNSVSFAINIVGIYPCEISRQKVINA